MLGEVLPPAPIPRAAGDEKNVSLHPAAAATGDGGDAEKKCPPVELAGCSVLLFASQAASIAAAAAAAPAGKDDDNAGLRSRLRGGGKYLAAAGDPPLVCAFAAVSARALPLAVPECPTHLFSMMPWREKETEGEGR